MNTILKKLSAHLVGNKGTGQAYTSSKTSLDLDEATLQTLGNGFLSRFTTESDRYSFHHPSSLNYNEVYNYCLESFAEESTFHNNSVKIGKHLFESSIHPKIKSGELYVCYFKNYLLNNTPYDAIGIFKVENKSNFIDLGHQGNDFNLQMKEGVEVSKFDKGCLVVCSNAEAGFDVFICDNNNKGEEAVFWRETFLNIVPQANEYYQTNQFLNLTRQFIQEQVPQEFEMAKTDLIDLLNKSVEYFKDNSAFSRKDFESTVLQDSKLIRSFNKYGDDFAETNDLDMPEKFDISTLAVKKQARVFKSVLKLDNNFHVYIHGNKDLIERGYDPASGKKFYKIFFDEEL